MRPRDRLKTAPSVCSFGRAGDPIWPLSGRSAECVYCRQVSRPCPACEPREQDEPCGTHSVSIQSATRVATHIVGDRVHAEVVHPKTPKRLERFAETHRQVGAICWAATHLELELMDAVVELARSPHVQVVVQGERGSTLIRWMERMLRDRVVDLEASKELAQLTRISTQLVRGNRCGALWPVCGSDVHVGQPVAAGRQPKPT